MSINRLHIKLTTTIIIIFFASLAISYANIDYQEHDITPNTVFAEFNGGTITKADFDKELDNIPTMYRSRYTTSEGKENLLMSMITNEIFYLKALEMGIDTRPETQAKVQDNLTRFYALEYIRRNITNQVEVEKQEIIEYYQDYSRRFTEPANTTIKYIKVEDNESAINVSEQLDQGVDFIDLINRYSVNEYSKRNQGIIRNIRGSGYIQGVGREAELDNAIKEAPLEQWVGPIKTDIGYHFFKVIERIPEIVKPLEEVREQIVARLRPMREALLREEVKEDLMKKYDLSINENLLNTVNVTNITAEDDDLDQLIVDSNENELQITIRDVHSYFRQLSPQERSQMNNPAHIIRWLNSIVEHNLFAYEARVNNYEKYLMDDPDVQQVKRNTILRELFQELVLDYASASDEQIEKYYTENIASYTSDKHRTIQLFMFETNRNARKARRRIVRAIRNNDSDTIDEVIEGSLYTRNSGIITDVYSAEISQFKDNGRMAEAVWETNVGEVSSIKQNNEGNFFFVKIIEEFPSTVTPITEVKTQIRDLLSSSKRETRWIELQQELKQDFNVVTYPERVAVSFSANELFDLAEDALKRNRHHEALDYYNRIINIFRNNSDDYKALFMKAFLLAEDLNQEEEAVEYFKQLINEYPHADLHESAEFMIKSIQEDFKLFDD